MDSKSLLSMGAVLLLGAFASARAHAGCASELVVVGRAGVDTIRIYDAEGHKLEDVPKALALNQVSKDCNESLGLVKIALTDAREVWVNRSEAKRVDGIAKNSPTCKADPAANDPTHVLGATNGVDPGCTPAAR